MTLAELAGELGPALAWSALGFTVGLVVGLMVGLWLTRGRGRSPWHRA